MYMKINAQNRCIYTYNHICIYIYIYIWVLRLLPTKGLHSSLGSPWQVIRIQPGADGDLGRGSLQARAVRRIGATGWVQPGYYLGAYQLIRLMGSSNAVARHGSALVSFLASAPGISASSHTWEWAIGFLFKHVLL